MPRKMQSRIKDLVSYRFDHRVKGEGGEAAYQEALKEEEEDFVNRTAWAFSVPKAAVGLPSGQLDVQTLWQNNNKEESKYI